MSFTTHNTFLFFSAILCLVPETLALETLLDRGCYSKFLDLENYQKPSMCEHRFCSQTRTIWDRYCTVCFSLANIFNQSRNKSFGAKLQSEVTSGFTQVLIGNLINQSATSCAISIPPLLEDCSEQKTFKDVARRRLR